MTPLLDLDALRALLPLVALVAPAVLALIVMRAVLQMRLDAKAEEFHERCQRIDAARWHERKAA